MVKFITTICFSIFFTTTSFASTISSNGDFTEFDDEFTQEEKEVNGENYNPLEGYNRFMTQFNDTFYIYIFRPVAVGVDTVVHDDIQQGVANMFDNSTFPIRFVNNILQLKFDKALVETGRFIVNTTVGVLGFFDIAKSELDLTASPEDFGQTLGYYGVSGGWHIVLPILGPSNMRDLISMVPDTYLDPTSYNQSRGCNIPKNMDHSLALEAVEQINKGSMHYPQYDLIREDAIDLYPYLRNMYEQRRAQLIKE